MTGRYFLHQATVAGCTIKDAEGGALASFSNDPQAALLLMALFSGLEREGHSVIDQDSGRYMAGARLEAEPPAIGGGEDQGGTPAAAQPHVVVFGNPHDGFRLFGPFVDATAGMDWGEDQGEGGEWTVPLYAPEQASEILFPFLYPALAARDAEEKAEQRRTRAIQADNGGTGGVS